MSEKPIADRFFDVAIQYGVLETEVEDALIAAMGLDITGPVASWPKFPFDGWCFDYYDTSFELRGTNPGWAPTPEQLAEAWALGFSRCWICYTDGTERYASKGYGLGQPAVKGVKSSCDGVRIKRLEKQLAALAEPPQ